MLDSIGDKTVQEDEQLTFTITATDPDEDELTYDATGDLAEYFDESTQIFDWTPDYSEAGSYQMTFSVSDGELTDQETITITVTEEAVNRAPVLDSIGDKTVQEDEQLTFTITATDPDEDELTYDATGDLAEYFDESTQIFDWTPDYSEAGSYQMIFSVSDGELTDQETITITVNNINRAPVLDSIGDKTVQEDEQLTFTITATDPDEDELTYDATGDLAEYFDESTQIFDWTPDYSEAGSYQMIFSVSDGELTDQETITITVNNINRAPVLDSIGDKTVQEDEQLTFTITATDPDEDELTYDATGDLAEYFDESTQIFDWTPDYSEAGSYQMIFSVSDGELTDQETITITVNNTDRAPVLNVIGDKEVDEDSELNFVVSGYDPDGDEIHLSVTDLPEGASFNTSTGEFNWIPDYDAAGIYEVSFTAEANGKSDSEVITIVVNDVIMPNGVSIDQDYINDSNKTNMSFTFTGAEVGREYTYSIDDTNGGTLAVTGNGTIIDSDQQVSDIDVSSLDDSTLTLTVFLLDDQGNPQENGTDTVLKDTVVPNFVSVIENGDSTYKSGETISFIVDLNENELTVIANLSVLDSDFASSQEFNDNGDGTYNYTTDPLNSNGNMQEGSSITISVTATDIAGNTKTDDSVTLLLDKTAPAAPTVNGISTGSYNTNQRFTLSGEAGAAIEYSLNNGTDWNDYSAEVNLSDEGIYEILARQTDEADNLSNNSNLITVTIDKTAPEIISITPTDGGTDLDVETDIVVVFDESLDTNVLGEVSFANPVITYTNGSNCSISFSSTTAENDTVTINPSESLIGETTYSNITINGFKDTVGNAMNSYVDSNYDFTTMSVASIPDDYTARWRFENNLDDETGNYDAVLREGSYDFDSMAFEGSSSILINGGDTIQVEISPEDKLPKFENNTISLSACFCVDSSAAGFPTVVEQDGILTIYYDVANSKLVGELLYSRAIVEITGVNKAAWYHVVVTYDGNELIMYLNGGSQSTSTTINDEISLEGAKYIFLGSSVIYSWQGLIDDVIIYHRALSATEVSDIYNTY